MAGIRLKAPINDHHEAHKGHEVRRDLCHGLNDLNCLNGWTVPALNVEFLNTRLLWLTRLQRKLFSHRKPNGIFPLSSICLPARQSLFRLKFPSRRKMSARYES